VGGLVIEHCTVNGSTNLNRSTGNGLVTSRGNPEFHGGIWLSEETHRQRRLILANGAITVGQHSDIGFRCTGSLTCRAVFFVGGANVFVAADNGQRSDDLLFIPGCHACKEVDFWGGFNDCPQLLERALVVSGVSVSVPAAFYRMAQGVRFRSSNKLSGDGWRVTNGRHAADDVDQ